MIIVVQTAFLGDLILSVPAIRRIRHNFPDQKIGVVCKKGLGRFLKHFNICEQVFEVEKNNRSSYKEVLARINEQNVYGVFCFHRSIRSLLLTFQIKASEKYGFASWFGYFVFDRTVSYIQSWPDVVRYMVMLRLVDQDVDEYFEMTASGDLQNLNYYDDKNFFTTIPPLFRFGPLKSSTPILKQKVVVFPGSVWATKKWTRNGFINLLKLFKEKKIDVFLMGSPQEKSLCQEISDQSGWGIVKAGDLDIEQSIEFLSDANFVVCNDSASAHMAAFVNRPAFVVFGPTTLSLGFRPWNDESRVVEYKLDCRPCGAHGHHQCPLKHHHCMEKISAEDVWSMISQSGLLNNFL